MNKKKKKSSCKCLISSFTCSFSPESLRIKSHYKYKNSLQKKTLFSCKMVSPTITCQILAVFKIYAVPVFSENIYKLDLSFAQFKILQQFLSVEGSNFQQVHSFNRCSYN